MESIMSNTISYDKCDIIGTLENQALTHMGVQRWEAFKNNVVIPREEMDNDRRNKKILEGFSMETFDASLCARFRYIGQHSYYELNSVIARDLFEAICRFAHKEQLGYDLLFDKMHFVRVDERLCDTHYCQMEWFASVIEKSKNSKNNSFLLL